MAERKAFLMVFLLVELVILFIFIGVGFLEFTKIGVESIEVSTEEGVITESLYFDDLNLQGKFSKNELTNEANIKIEYLIKNDEYEDNLEKPIDNVPFRANFICNLFAVALFEPSLLNELEIEKSMIENSNLLDLLKDNGEVSSFTVLFLEEETKEELAECTGRGLAWGDIEFKSHKDYSNIDFLKKLYSGYNPVHITYINQTIINVINVTNVTNITEVTDVKEITKTIIQEVEVEKETSAELKTSPCLPQGPCSSGFASA